MFETYYLDEANLTFIASDGSVFNLKGLTGVQQGDPSGSGLFACGQHPTLVRLANRHQQVYIVAYADNIFIIGKLSQCLDLADELKTTMLEDLDLDIQVNSSWVHVPAWAHLPSPPPVFVNPPLPRRPALTIGRRDFAGLSPGTGAILQRASLRDSHNHHRPL
jgi:hypothetical protein